MTALKPSGDAGEVVRWTPTTWFPPDHNGEAAGDMKRSVSGEYVEFTAYATLERQLATAREALENIRELNFSGADENGNQWANSDLIDQEIIAALAALTPGVSDAE